MHQQFASLDLMLCGGVEYNAENLTTPYDNMNPTGQHQEQDAPLEMTTSSQGHDPETYVAKAVKLRRGAKALRTIR